MQIPKSLSYVYCINNIFQTTAKEYFKYLKKLEEFFDKLKSAASRLSCASSRLSLESSTEQVQCSSFSGYYSEWPNFKAELKIKVE